jgi:hypothetical protein
MSEATTSATTKILGVLERSLLTERKIRRRNGNGKCVVNSGVVLNHTRNHNVMTVVGTVVQAGTNLYLTIVLPLPPVVEIKQMGKPQI